MQAIARRIAMFAFAVMQWSTHCIGFRPEWSYRSSTDPGVAPPYVLRSWMGARGGADRRTRKHILDGSALYST